MTRIEQLEELLAKGRDDALLRYSLGIELQRENRLEEATNHLAEAVRMNPEFSAAWKALGKAWTVSGRQAEAREAYRSGIAAARRRGDRQAEKEMGVFLKRLEGGNASR